MKLHAVNIVYAPPNSNEANNEAEALNASSTPILCASEDLGEFSFFYRSGVREGFTFSSRLLANRTPASTRQQFDKEKNGVNIYVHKRSSGLTGVLFTDKEYPSSAAFCVLFKIITEYEKQNGGQFQQMLKSNKLNEDFCLPMQQLDSYIQKYQDPAQADDLLKIKQDLAETKTVVGQAIDNVLQRGEKLSTLVQKSDDLSFYSKSAYEKSESMNDEPCCTIQ